MFLGRMNPDKGVHRAIAVARAAGKRLLIAAKMWESAERRYFAKQLEPLLRDHAVYLGDWGGQRRLDLLAGAEALLNPIRWPDPFGGLVVIKALACGTPVLAFAEGAAPEIVEHGRTGLLCTVQADITARLIDVRVARPARLPSERHRALSLQGSSTAIASSTSGCCATRPTCGLM